MGKIIRNKIVEIEGKFYAMNFSDNSFVEVSDYKYPQKDALTPFACVIDRKEYIFCNETMYQITKKWGCINNRNEIIIPCVYDEMIVLDKVCIAKLKYKKCYFNIEGIPIFCFKENGIKKTVKFTEWEYVEDFEGKVISIGKKDGKYGILRVDGSCFLPPEYECIHIDWSNKCITAEQRGKTTQILFFKQKGCWSPIPNNFSFCRKEWDLYILQRDNKFAAINDKQEIIAPPFFDNIKVLKNIIIASFKGRKGAISREYIAKEPYCDIMLPFKYDDIKEGEVSPWGISQHLIIIKDNKQGIYNIEDRKVILEPTIDKDLRLFTNTIGENMVGFCSDDGKYGFVDFNGKVLFNIERYLCFEGKMTPIRIPVYFNYGGFKNGIVRIDRGNYYEEYDKEGIIIQKKWTRPQSYDNTYDYKEETWEAMTDGIYGEMPENFDGDYSFMGH